LSIKPEFASAIISGSKKFEFRRAIFSQTVDVVVVYVTVPVKQIVCEFDVRNIISGDLDLLWKRTRRFAGIEKRVFCEYFRGMKVGHAIEIGEVRTYKTPYCPIKQLGIKPPQSFLYLSREN
jgi:predicted transcriptional regulator